ncbi:uncharacterized protein EDB91DRAFT_1076840 [Suillus paluster]|uniref:uncharacterized protein n=1 Tax=Suillus paluster TaxID=48578 RepID=UPI001B864AA3|nr:uncharacterized protein EDB91DRAFT_1076840 [Suillus paluster]KAG1754734.1 hypothetical protein EDB91DRAFT_1076840 [Suillus paluster]
MSLIRIELVCSTNQRGEELTSHGISEVDVHNGCPSVGNNETHILPVESHKPGEMESIANLKERLQLAELSCSRLKEAQELYQKYRLRWLEESYRARVLEGYAPHGINTYSPRQITWDAPSPIQSDDDDKVELYTTIEAELSEYERASYQPINYKEKRGKGS